MSHRKGLFLVTAVVEAATGAALLAVPAVPIALLLGLEQPAPEALFIARVAGAALLAIGVACGVGRDPARLDLLLGVLVYDAAAALLLLYAALAAGWVGVALWPAVVLHLGLAAWCVVCLATGRATTASEVKG
jgi:hypothetical protein